MLTFQIVDTALFIESGLKHEWYERARNTQKPFASFVFFREFRDSQLPPKRPVQQRLEEMLRLALGFVLLGAQVDGDTVRGERQVVVRTALFYR